MCPVPLGTELLGMHSSLMRERLLRQARSKDLLVQDPREDGPTDVSLASEASSRRFAIRKTWLRGELNLHSLDGLEGNAKSRAAQVKGP